MSVYLCNRILDTKSRADHPVLRAKGITNYTGCPLTSLSISGFATQYQTAFSPYRDNIALFLAAATGNVPIPTDRICASILCKADLPAIDFPSPKIAYVSDLELSADQLELLVKKLETGQPEVSSIGKTKKIVIGKPSIKMAMWLAGSCKDSVNCNTGEVHPQVWIKHYQLRQILHAFLSVHQYAPFVMEDVEMTQEQEDDDEEVTEQKKQDASFTDLGSSSLDAASLIENVLDKARYDEMMATLQSKIFGQMIDLGDEGDVEMVTMDNVKDMLDCTSGFLSSMGSGIESVPVARPKTIPVASNFGPVSAVPSMPGLFFPFFEGVHIPDSSSLKNNFLRHFTRGLGNTPMEMAKGAKQFKRAMASIGSDVKGVAMSHVFIGVDLALSTQARLYVIVENGEYLGFVLLGRCFRVVINNDTFVPYKSQYLDEELQKVSSHSSAVVNLCKKLSKIALIKAPGSGEGAEDMLEEISPDTIVSSWSVVDVLSKREITDSDLSGLSDSFAKLRFAERHRPFTMREIMDIFDQCTGDRLKEPEKRDYGVYLPEKGSIMLSSKLGRLFLTFGNEGPSPFSNDGGKVSCGKFETKGTGKDKEILPTIAAVDVLPSIILARKSVELAFLDWIQFMEKGNFIFKEQDRSKKSKSLVITKDTKLFQEALLRWRFANGGKPAEPKSKKRKRGGDDEDSGVKRFKDAAAMFAMEVSFD